MTLDYLYRTKYAQMKYYAHMLVGAFLAEDVVQSVLMKLYEKKVSYENARYMWRNMIRNEALNMVKHEKINTLHTKIYANLNADAVDRINIEFDFTIKVYELIQSLPKKCRHIVELYYFEEKNSTEIAAQLGVSPSTITSQLSRAKKLLAPYFK